MTRQGGELNRLVARARGAAAACLLIAVGAPAWAQTPDAAPTQPDAAPARPAGAAQPPAPATFPGRDAALIELARAIHVAAQRQDTNHRVFHGCWDWHSAVHGHWALLRVARVTGRAEREAAWVEAQLSEAGIAHERALLRAHPKFENPYGRAWFLRLALEFEAWARPRGVERPDRLHGTADDVATGLLARYADRGFDPSEDTYSSSAWALVQLHAWLSHRQDPRAETVAGWIANGTASAPRGALSFSEDATRTVFFSRYGNWAYAVAKTCPADLEAFLAAHPPGELGGFDPVEGKAHHLGLVWSRAWALRALARQAGSPALRRDCDRAYRDHVRRGLAQHARHADDFRAYGHWVPQFAVYALTDGEAPRYFH